MQHTGSSLQYAGSLVEAGGLSSCGVWASLPRGMWDLSSLTRNQTCVPCIAGRILYHWTTREVHVHLFLIFELKFFFDLFLFILFLAGLGVCCCAWAFSSCGERGLLFIAVRGLLIAVASPVAEHGL